MKLTMAANSTRAESYISELEAVQRVTRKIRHTCLFLAPWAFLNCLIPHLPSAKFLRKPPAKFPKDEILERLRDLLCGPFLRNHHSCCESAVVKQTLWFLSKPIVCYGAFKSAKT